MSTENEITCPHCGTSFALTEAIAAPLREKIRTDLEETISAERKAREQAEADLARMRAELESARAAIQAEIAEGIAAKRPEWEASIRKALAAEMGAELKAKEEENQTLRSALDEAQKAQLQALKAQQEAERKAASVDLEVQKRVNAELAEIRQQAAKEAEEASKLKLAEKDMTIKRLTEHLELMKRQAEQGSQRDQGEVAELELEDELRSAFPWDDVEAVKSGVRGADVIQRVRTGAEAVAGTILWERKRAQAWGADWLDKAKRDMRDAKADTVVIVSEVLPKGIARLDCCEGVWVVEPSLAVPLAKTLRAGILDTAVARRAMEGRKSNAERAYDYLTGPEFVARLKGIAEPFIAMQADLERERRVMERNWARRRKQIDRVLEAVFGMRGEIEALIGSEFPQLEAIDVEPPELPEASDDDSGG